MEGKKRKRMELSLKTSKKQAVGKSKQVENDCDAQTEQKLIDSKLETKKPIYSSLIKVDFGLTREDGSLNKESRQEKEKR